jgi:hypothetical protein
MSQKEQDKHKNLSHHWQKLEKYFRMLRRAIKLGVTITPLLLLYPLHRLLSLYHYLRGNSGTQLEDSTVLDWWVKLCMWSVERNGAALVKLLQVSWEKLLWLVVTSLSSWHKPQSKNDDGWNHLAVFFFFTII